MSLAMGRNLHQSLRALASHAYTGEQSGADVVPLAADREPTAPTSVAEAELALREEFESLRGQYRPESVTALLDLLDGAAEDVAAHERETWVDALNTVASRCISTPFAPGLRHAAALINRNRRNP